MTSQLTQEALVDAVDYLDDWFGFQNWPPVHRLPELLAGFAAQRVTATKDAESEAQAMVARWEHGSEEHRQWLRDMCVPEIAAALTAATDKARREALEIVTDVARRAAESAQVTPRQMDTIPTADEWKARQHYLHGKRHACAEIYSAIRALTPQNPGDAAPSRARE